jgi:hypothetical protein
VAPDVPARLSEAQGDLASRLEEAATRQSPTAGFDERNEIVRNPDGTVTTKKSQQLGNIRQLRDDASALAENAKDLLGVGSEAAMRSAEESRARQDSSERSRAIQETAEVPRMTPNSGKRR